MVAHREAPIGPEKFSGNFSEIFGQKTNSCLGVGVRNLVGVTA